MIEVKHNMTFLSCGTSQQLSGPWNAIVPSTMLLASHDIDASSFMSTGTISHIIHLTHLYMMIVMVSLMETSASCCRKNYIC